MTDQGDIAFLGTGLMGAPMAARLLVSGQRLTVWNRNREKLRPLQAMGAIAAPDPAGAAHTARFVILMFDTAATTEHVLFESGVAEALPPDALVIDMSSNDPSTARGIAQRLSARGIDFLDAPVSGGTKGAEDGSLAIMVGGEPAVFERARPVFAPMGRATYVGPAGSGQLAKLANQIIVAVTIGAVSEALLFAAAGGADPAAVRTALGGGFADSRILQLHGARMIDRTFEPGGTIANQLKDLDAVAKAARGESLSLPLLEGVRAAFGDLVRQGDADKDHSAFVLWLEQLNGKTVA